MTRRSGDQGEDRGGRGGRRDSCRARHRPRRAGQARPPAVAVSFDRIAAFTPASADPRLAAAFAGRGAAIDDFKFTPAAAKGRPSQIRVAVRAARRWRRRRAAPVEVAAAPVATALDRRQLQPRRRGRLEAVRALRRRRQGRRAPIPRSATARARWSASAITSTSSPAGSRSAPIAATAASPRCRSPTMSRSTSARAYNLNRRIARHRRRPLPRRPGPPRRRSPTSAATARPSTSAPPSILSDRGRRIGRHPGDFSELMTVSVSHASIAGPAVKPAAIAARPRSHPFRPARSPARRRSAPGERRVQPERRRAGMRRASRTPATRRRGRRRAPPAASSRDHGPTG